MNMNFSGRSLVGPLAAASLMALSLAVNAQSGTSGSGTPQVPMSSGAGGTISATPSPTVNNGNPNTSTLPQRDVAVPGSKAAAAKAAARAAPAVSAASSNSIMAGPAAADAMRPGPRDTGGMNSSTSPGNPQNKLGAGTKPGSVPTGGGSMTGGSVDTNGNVQPGGGAKP